MRATLSKEFRFEASHVLANHNGKCARMHGHSYRVVVEVEGPIRPADGSPQEGMVADFGHLSLIWDQTGGQLDHRHLNDIPGLASERPTTAENIAAWLLDQLRQAARAYPAAWGSSLITAVTVWETAKCSARVTA